MSGCNPAKWLWGAIPAVLVALLVIAGEGPKIERDLAKEASALLNEQGHGWASIRFNGRQAVLTGTAFSSDQRSEAVKIVSRIAGVGVVADRAKLLPGVSPYTWWVTREDRTIKIKGHVPSDADQQTILGIVKATMPELTIDDRMKLASGAPPKQRWLGAISFALNQLGAMNKGAARLTGMQLDISGEAATETAYLAILDALEKQLPEGLELSKSEVAAPVASPYSWAILYKNGKVTISGHIPNEKLRRALLANIEESFSGIVMEDAMKLGSGEPEGWPKALEVIVAQLSRLEEGEVKVEDNAVSMTGLADDEATAKDAVKTLRGNLPSIFKSEEKVRIRKTDDSGGKRNEKPDRTMVSPPLPKAAGPTVHSHDASLRRPERGKEGAPEFPGLLAGERRL